MTPNGFAIFALIAWPVLMLALATVIPVRRVVLVSILGGNLFLPATGIAMVGIPNYTKLIAAGLGALIPAFFFAAPKLFAWRPKLLDLFFFGFLAAPGISSLMNGLGAYDATSATVNRCLEWGVAYWIGRTLFNDLGALRDICYAVVVSALIYAPLCLFEMRMSPQLSMMVYGFRPSTFGMTVRYGGYRPLVFMQHGLALATWMASAALVAWILWRSKAIRHIWGIPIIWIAIGLAALTVGMRSTGAAILLVGMIGAAEFIQYSRLRPVLIAMVMIPMAYIGLRSVGWDGRQIVSIVQVFGDERVRSFEGRILNDAMIAEKAMQRPAFGWGGWGRWRIRDEFGNDITVSDSWWTILLGTTGLFGMICAYGTFIAPLFPLARHKAKTRIFFGPLGAAWALGFGVLLFVIDSLANAMPNTSFILVAAALVSIYPLVSPAAMHQMRQRHARSLQSATNGNLSHEKGAV